MSATAEHLPIVIKYPRTTHLFDAGGTATTSDDLVLSASDFSAVSGMFDGSADVIVEEKIDGANMGFRVAKGGEILAQNRSRYISSGDHAQFSRLQEWVELHRAALIGLLGGENENNLILYGEWCVAKHSLKYDRLPDFFVAFDLFDTTENKFYSRRRFHTAMKDTGIFVVPTIGVRDFQPEEHQPSTSSSPRKKKNATKKPSPAVHTSKHREAVKQQITALLETRSVFRREGTVEGVVLRQDEEDWLLHRFKVVRPDFVGGCASGHWTRRPIDKQEVNYEFSESYRQQCYVFATEDCTVEEKAIGDQVNSSSEPKPDEDSKPAATLKPNNAAKKSRKAKDKAALDKQSAQNEKNRRRRVPRCIMLVGLPGSGKSTFATALKNGFDQDNTKAPCFIANQDTLGRKECVKVASRANTRVRVILDRCNLTVSERKEWLGCMHSPPPGEVALVFFNVSTETSVARVHDRVNHPTIAHGKGSRIVKQLAEKMQPPTLEERKSIFGTVETVSSFEQSDALLRKWGMLSTPEGT